MLFSSSVWLLKAAVLSAFFSVEGHLTPVDGPMFPFLATSIKK
jgi:hypothetical protein